MTEQSREGEQFLHPRQFAMALQKCIPPSYTPTPESIFAQRVAAALAEQGALPTDVKINETENTVKIWTAFLEQHQKLSVSGKSVSDIKKYFSDVQSNLEEQ